MDLEVDTWINEVMYTPLTDRVLEYTRGKIRSMHLLLALLSRDQLVISSHVDAARFRYSIIRSMQQEMDIQHLFCDFCSSSQHDVLKLIAGPNTYICNECVEKAEGALQNKFVSRVMSTAASAANTRTRSTAIW